MPENRSSPPARSAEQPSRFDALRTEPKRAVPATGASGTALLEGRFYGCLVLRLYNDSRSHASLADRTPGEFASQHAPSRVLADTANGCGLTQDLVQEN